jgi:2-haloacid dehalogenase
MAAPQALLIDVFGTSVDWYSGIARALGAVLGLPPGHSRIAKLTLAWRQAYFDGIAEIRQGRLPWRRVDEIHAEALDRLLPQHGFDLTDQGALAQLNLAWHRLDPWPDTLEALHRLRRRHTVTTLSNANLDLLIDLADHGGMPWDKLFCSDIFNHYKPDPETYIGACSLLDLAPHQAMMVACHRGDLQAAARLGLHTAFISRPAEYGDTKAADEASAEEFDLVCTSFTELANRLEETHERAKLV